MCLKEVIKLSNENITLSKDLQESEKKKQELEVKLNEIVHSMNQLASVFESKPIAVLAITIGDYLKGPSDKGLSVAKV